MSRAFVKEDAPSEAVVVPPRAPLPPDTPNQVTARGLALLEAELAHLQTERSQAAGIEDERDRARQLALVDGSLSALRERLASAAVVPPPDALTPGALTKVVFGTQVTVRTLSGKFAGEVRRFTLVGVDEAGNDDAVGDEMSVAFTAPIAQALLGRRVGEQVEFEVAKKTQVLEIVALERPQ